MDVYVIPVGNDRYELYCEGQAFEAEPVSDTPPRGIVARFRQRVKSMLRAAEERQRSDEPPEPKGWIGRQQDRMMAWVVERIAEQRLLWNLRGQTTAAVIHPQDLSFDQVLTIVRRALHVDYERHRKWMIFDGIAFLVTFIGLGPLFLVIPGVANIPALYFGFRVVGHWLSMRGAADGLYRAAWTGRPCPPLGELREVAAMEPRVRDARVHDIASRLRLQHLSTFFERVAIPQA